MNPSTRAALIRLWRPHYEICGLVLKDGRHIEIHNAAKDTSRNFAFDRRDLEEFINEYRMSDVMGMFHTHPTNRQSPTQGDIAGWPKLEGIRYFIVTENDVIEWEKWRDGTVVRLA